MATEINRAIREWSWSFSVVVAFCVGAVLATIEDAAGLSQATDAVTMVLIGAYMVSGSHKGVSAFALTAYALYMFSSIDLYMVSIMLNMVLCALFIILWRKDYAMQQERPKKATPQADYQARA
jgi:hypothetical protein